MEWIRRMLGRLHPAARGAIHSAGVLAGMMCLYAGIFRRLAETFPSPGQVLLACDGLLQRAPAVLVAGLLTACMAQIWLRREK